MGHACDGCGQGAQRLGRDPPRWRDEQRSAAVARDPRQRRAEGGGILRREAGGLALATHQHREARARQGLDPAREALRSFGKPHSRNAVHGAEGVEHIVAAEAVMQRGRDQIEVMHRHFRVLDVQGKRVGRALDGKRDGHAPAANGDDEARPGDPKRLIGGDGAEQARQRQVDLQPRRQPAYGFGHGNALGLHADRAVGDDPYRARWPAFARSHGTSGTLEAQFLFDSFRKRT